MCKGNIVATYRQKILKLTKKESEKSPGTPQEIKMECKIPP